MNNSITQGSTETPPRVQSNKMNKATNMTQEDDYSEDDSLDVPSLMLDSKQEEPPFSYSNYRHTSYDGLIGQRSGRYHSLSIDDTISNQEALYTSSVFLRPQRTRRSSSQADSILHALTPPSHSLKARRFSKSNESSVPMTRKRSLVSDHQKEFGTHSAVSPRFMTLRKLSEVTTLPSYGYPYAQDVPPVPQIPSHLTPSSSPPLVPIAPPSPPSTHSPVHGPKPDMEPMQYHINHMAWVSENQRAWEDQRNEAFGLATALVNRIEHDLKQKMTILDTVQSEAALQARVAELEKQHEIDVAIIKSQQIDQEKIESRLKKQEEVRLLDLKTQNKNLKAHVARVEQANRVLASALAEKEQLEVQSRLDTQMSLVDVQPAIQHTQEQKDVKPEGTTWADIMESEDEAKKNVELWAVKYRELEKVHQDFISKLKLEKASYQKWKAEKGKQLRQLKQVDSINRVQLEYLQSELKKAQPNAHCACCKFQIKQRPCQKSQSYVAKDGYLIFTAEMNGRLSKYSVKIPQKQAPKLSLNPNAPSWNQS